MKFNEIEKIVTKDGWFLARVKGSHYHYHHPAKKGTVTIPYHSGDIPLMVINSILKQAGLQ
jgi:predicted RNA binding protein YcfA (HicA-like mRNA interferase family)